MAFLNFFKQSKKMKGLRAPKQSERRTQEKGTRSEEPESNRQGGVKKAARQAQEEKSAQVRSGESKMAWRVLRAPHVTEKATNLTHINQYVFRTENHATKQEVKRAIEEMYGVHVISVRKIHIPGKEKQRGRHRVWQSGYTKAIVKIRPGEKIEVLPH